MHLLFRHCLCLLMALLVLSISATCFCRDNAPPHAAAVAESGDCGHCPGSDDQGHSVPHTCCSCGCACHSQLPEEALLIAYRPHSASLDVSENFTRLPEVYLPTFVPPHILA